MLQRTQAYSRLRENSKSHLVRLIDIGRSLALKAGQYLVDEALLSEPEAVFLLESDEVKAALRGETSPENLARLLRQRRLERQRYAALQPPGAFVGEQPCYEHALTEQGTTRGLPSSPVVWPVLPVWCARHKTVPASRLATFSSPPRLIPVDTVVFVSGRVGNGNGWLFVTWRDCGPRIRYPGGPECTLATQYVADGSMIVLDGGAESYRLRHLPGNKDPLIRSKYTSGPRRAAGGPVAGLGVEQSCRSSSTTSASTLRRSVQATKFMALASVSSVSAVPDHVLKKLAPLAQGIGPVMGRIA